MESKKGNNVKFPFKNSFGDYLTFARKVWRNKDIFIFVHLLITARFLINNRILKKNKQKKQTNGDVHKTVKQTIG